MVGGRDYFEKKIDGVYNHEKLFYEIAAKFNAFKITDAGGNIGDIFRQLVDSYVPENIKK